MDIYSSPKPYTYIIRFLPTGQVYYGMRSANIVPANQDLWIKYFTSSKKVKKLIKHYGRESFDFQIRKIFETHEEAAVWEKKVLTRLNVLKHPDKWLNESISGSKYLFKKHSDESKKKISAKHKGKILSEETKKKISDSKKGKVSYFPTDEQKLASSLRQKGIPKSRGWNHTKETKEKIGIKHKNKVVSEETRKKLSDAAKSRPRREHSEETKKKMRESARLNHQKNPRKYKNDTKIPLDHRVEVQSYTSPSAASFSNMR